RLETTNGRITVALPKSVAAILDAATTNGGITTDLPLTTTETRQHSALRGMINGGGTAELRLRTTNGSINIEAR
ncbi:MAG TPA: DUF4097 family beta strand repeat-containing protein, partial [Thermoanaerobaculia bacterium]